MTANVYQYLSKVRWPNGVRADYRYGADEKYDLIIIRYYDVQITSYQSAPKFLVTLPVFQVIWFPLLQINYARNFNTVAFPLAKKREYLIDFVMK